jgi:hypothetical protein
VDYDLTSDTGRAKFIFQQTGGKTGSLSAFLQTATEEQAAELIAKLGAAKTEYNARRYGEIYEKNYEDLPMGARKSESVEETKPSEETEDPSAF